MSADKGRHFPTDAESLQTFHAMKDIVFKASFSKLAKSDYFSSDPGIGAKQATGRKNSSSARSVQKKRQHMVPCFS